MTDVEPQERCLDDFWTRALADFKAAAEATKEEER